ncbi:hypothetical protein SFR_5725 [Streptomyces sp. FR-008]|nr:hypothetical protein SFR_5725 [Streptomyces sp. FR-008]
MLVVALTRRRVDDTGLLHSDFADTQLRSAPWSAAEEPPELAH